MVCGYFREDIPCELLGICILVHVNKFFQMKDNSISVDGARYATSIVAKYLDTATVKASKTFYKTTFPPVMISTKEDVSTSDEQVEKLCREFNIHYRACIDSFIYLFSTRVELSIAVHKLYTQFYSCRE